jgi:hypothetical protein
MNMCSFQVEINNFRECFERGEDPLRDVNDASDINSVAGVLKLYLRELREPLFPTVYFEQLMDLARKFFILLLLESSFISNYPLWTMNRTMVGFLCPPNSAKI